MENSCNRRRSWPVQKFFSTHKIAKKKVTKLKKCFEKKRKLSSSFSKTFSFFSKTHVVAYSHNQLWKRGKGVFRSLRSIGQNYIFTKATSFKFTFDSRTGDHLRHLARNTQVSNYSVRPKAELPNYESCQKTVRFPPRGKPRRNQENENPQPQQDASFPSHARSPTQTKQK